jgi:hypothetical protein
MKWEDEEQEGQSVNSYLWVPGYMMRPAFLPAVARLAHDRCIPPKNKGGTLVINHRPCQSEVAQCHDDYDMNDDEYGE